ncbi:MAG: SPOR domain-containing protein [Sorangiineae bacterium]|nr:SPOR domain-containing protein [Polyangiaceae bacterium]MEB2324793.1 SPOR domain-containing protein [Sorangiineae bacterium]
MDSVNVRNLEQIQEQDPRRRSGRLGTLLLASMGGAALVVVGLMSAKRSGPPAKSPDDPLAALVARSRASAELPAEQLDDRNVTFPGILSDGAEPTTALAVVKDERGRLVKRDDELALPPGAPTAPPPPTDALPVVPLPAGSLLEATPVTTQPQDGLAAMASAVSKVPDGAELAPEGSAGGFQLQVASFKEQKDADAFVLALRRRGHQAYRQAAYVTGRGLWHRVRIGPFKSRYQADAYKTKLDKSERTAAYLIDPQKEAQAQEVYDAKLSARIKKYGRP